MILLGCLLAFSIAVAPRVVLVLAWLFGDRWEVVWQGEWIWPLLGIVFLPYTTVMYLLAWSPALTPGAANIEGWDWMWILLGLLLDLMKWGQIIQNRKAATDQVQRYYPSGAPRSGDSGAATAAVAGGQTPASMDNAAPEPVVATTSPEPQADPGPAPSAGAGGELAELDRLKAAGALSDEEYEAAKAKLQG